VNRPNAKTAACIFFFQYLNISITEATKGKSNMTMQAPANLDTHEHILRLCVMYGIQVKVIDNDSLLGVIGGNMWIWNWSNDQDIPVFNDTLIEFTEYSKEE